VDGVSNTELSDDLTSPTQIKTGKPALRPTTTRVVFDRVAYPPRRTGDAMMRAALSGREIKSGTSRRRRTFGDGDGDVDATDITLLDHSKTRSRTEARRNGGFHFAQPTLRNFVRRSSKPSGSCRGIRRSTD
jgi:hypothetical protein